MEQPHHSSPLYPTIARFSLCPSGLLPVALTVPHASSAPPLRGVTDPPSTVARRCSASSLIAPLTHRPPNNVCLRLFTTTKQEGNHIKEQ